MPDDLAGHAVDQLGSGSCPYAILGVEPTATQQEIRQKWRAISLACHPDKQRSKTQQEKDAAQRRFLAAKAATSAQRLSVIGTIESIPAGAVTNLVVLFSFRATLRRRPNR